MKDFQKPICACRSRDVVQIPQETLVQQGKGCSAKPPKMGLIPLRASSDTVSRR